MGNNLIIRGGADFSGFRKELSRAQGSLKNFQSQTSVISKSCSKMGTMLKSAFALVGVASMIKFGKESSDVAKNVEASVGRINDIFGQSSKSIYDFYNQNKKSLGMSESAVLQYAATYGNLFSTFNSNQAANAAMTQKYLTATSVIASKTGRTVNDVAERIRSGLLGNTEAIEDLGINVNIKTIEITDAFKRIANGKSWLQLDAYQQAEVRQLAILEQATKKYGITVADNGSFATQSFSASIENLKYTVGRFLNQAIIPAIKWLTIFFDKINEALTAMFGFNKKQGTQSNSVQSQADAIGAATDNQNKLTNAVKKTGKANENNLASFDSINVLAKSSSDSVDGSEDMAVGGGASDIPQSSMEIGGNVMISPKIQQAVDEITNIFKPLVSFLSSAWSDVSKFMVGQFEKIGDWFKTNKPIFDAFGKTVGDIATKAWELIKPIASTIWSVFKGVISAIVDVVLNLVSCFADFAKKVYEAYLVVLEFLDSIGVLDFLQIAIQTLITNIGAAFSGIVTIIGIVLERIIESLGFLLDFIKAVFTGDWKAAWQAICNIFKSIFGAVVDICKIIWNNISTAFTTFSTNFGLDWNAFWKGIGNFFIGIWNGIISAFESAVNWITGGINKLLDGINSLFDGAKDLLKKIGIDMEITIPNIPDIQFGRIPRLATGAVIPPNREFMAVLGDQRNGTNIETPLDTMVQAFKMANTNSGSNEIVIKFTGALSELVRILKPELDNESNRKGTRLVMG